MYKQIKKMKAKCTATAENGRINLIIQKSDTEYMEFVKILKGETVFWYGDVTDENGQETSGIIISVK